MVFVKPIYVIACDNTWFVLIALKYLSPYLFNLYSEYIMKNAELDEAQTGIKIVGRNINNLRYADYTILMAEN